MGLHLSPATELLSELAHIPALHGLQIVDL